MRVYICTDEWYPVYYPEVTDRQPHKQVEIPEELYNRWISLQKEFDEIQTELASFPIR